MYMIERADNIEDYGWTARRFMIQGPSIYNIRLVVIDLIDPIIQRIRHSDMAQAYRWYWSWKVDENNLYFRLYFMSHPDNFRGIWEILEKYRENNFNGIVNEGLEEKDVLSMSEEDLERGIILEYISEMTIMLWRGKSKGSKSQYISALHFFANQLALNDQDLFRYLCKAIGGVPDDRPNQ